MQGFIVVGLVLGIKGEPFSNRICPMGLYLCGTVLLIASIYAFNGWGGYRWDVHHPKGRPYLDSVHPTRRGELLAVSLLNLAAALVLMGGIGFLFDADFPFSRVIPLNLCFWCLWGLYSHPRVHAKAWPVFSSLIHLTGGALMFFLGFSPLHPVTTQWIVPAVYFGLLFEAGHLNHEVKDYEEDLGNGLKTNAVAFGKKLVFVVSFLLFLLSYAVLFFMVHQGLVGIHEVPLGLVVLNLHLLCFLKALRRGITQDAVLSYRKEYRFLYILLWAGSFF